jgi:hypothetical protein
MGRRQCELEGCSKQAQSGDASLQGAWRGQTLPARGLL